MRMRDRREGCDVCADDDTVEVSMPGAEVLGKVEPGTEEAWLICSRLMWVRAKVRAPAMDVVGVKEDGEVDL